MLGRGERTAGEFLNKRGLSVSYIQLWHIYISTHKVGYKKVIRQQFEGQLYPPAAECQSECWTLIVEATV